MEKWKQKEFQSIVANTRLSVITVRIGWTGIICVKAYLEICSKALVKGSLRNNSI